MKVVTLLALLMLAASVAAQFECSNPGEFGSEAGCPASYACCKKLDLSGSECYKYCEKLGSQPNVCISFYAGIVSDCPAEPFAAATNTTASSGPSSPAPSTNDSGVKSAARNFGNSGSGGRALLVGAILAAGLLF